ncbi:unnamed protein product [Caenorhabditis auriculariae]|uniref:Small ribosomal subunit protein mS25 n=1 Tax=Caenorhabditis auriculariae TaxID=2777116 RepID=A0A8S1HMH1_9PELO|nr:unnamed protein product [Caenorhabditis auriculariae]
MYKLEPYFSSEIKVQPKQTIYKLPSYHDDLSDVQNPVQGEVDPVKALELRQLRLIEELQSQALKLNELLTQKGKSSAPTQHEESKKKNVSAPVAAQKLSTPEPKKDDNDTKKNKDAKKEARKAAKTEAKNKVATGEQSVSKSSHSTSTGSDLTWIVYEEKKTIETGQSLTANLPPALLSTKPSETGIISLKVTKEDEVWLQRLANIGAKRKVAFEGFVANNVKDSKNTVRTEQASKVELSGGSWNISCRVAIWKVLGAALGIYSNSYDHAISSAHQHQWLTKTNRALSGKGDLDYLVREASQFLSRFDALSGLFEISLADVVLRSVLTQKNQPNNVELWANRIDSYDIRAHWTLQPICRSCTGKIKFRDNVQVFAIGFHRRPNEQQMGARDFVYWHWAQLQYHNSKVQLVKHVDKVITPFARAYLTDGREMLFDLEGMQREEIEETLARSLGKTELVERRERLESIAKLNPADFGSKSERQCICEVQGQHPCTALLHAPKCMTGKWRWNHNLI